ncbi:redoxin domain-containing protein [Maribacter sp. MJ134]|uniref:redoxin domain-containing protein n=1 Tax=Maribacter sp. MJ134 TaxID=2496865 RepID=UPI000F84904E|nr:redoxin domain-containing protein [Maribacter sp. MJ134]AZQ58048.1 redoxin domain-containing protein [Maribacter sp. MJ134]
MKNGMLFLLGLLTLVGCNQEPDGFTIDGTLRGEIEEGTKVFLKKIGDNNQPVEVDTATIANGKFQFKGTATAPELHYIFVDEAQGYTAVILENGTIDFNGQKDSLGFAVVKGTLQNDVFRDYLEQSRALSNKARSIQEDLQRATKDGSPQASIIALRDEMQELQEEYKGFELDYIKNNPNALISALLLDRAVATKAIGYEEIQTMYDALSPEIQNSRPGKRVLDGIEGLKKSEEAEKNTAIGAKAPEFSGPNPEGETVALSDVMGKVTLVDFWAAWCRPCRAENPNVVAVYNKYHDKGLNIVGVSLDRTAEAWKKAIADDGLEWNHISNIAYFDDQIAKLYNVDAIPAAFLLDENGIIVAKNLRGPALEEKVAELLN